MQLRVARAALLPAALLLAAAPVRAAAETEPRRDPPPQVVVIDPGHGGPDVGARGPRGRQEKDIVLEVSLRIGRALEAEGFTIVYTRSADTFVSLPERTAAANRARGDLFVSVHANSARSPRVSGVETYFLSVEASDDEAMAVAMTENQVYRQHAATPDSGYIVGTILGDLIRTEHLRDSGELAATIQRRLAPLTRGRGVKQAPFVVLMGVNMPAVLIELGFLTHPGEEARLSQKAHQRGIADAIADAVVQYREARTPRAEEVATE